MFFHFPYSHLLDPQTKTKQNRLNFINPSQAFIALFASPYTSWSVWASDKQQTQTLYN